MRQLCFETKSNEQGTILITGGFVLFLILWFGALAVDLGFYGRNQNQLKKAVDLGTAAAMGYRVDNGWWDVNTPPPFGDGQVELVRIAATVAADNLWAGGLIDGDGQSLVAVNTQGCDTACLNPATVCSQSYSLPNDPEFSMTARYFCGPDERVELDVSMGSQQPLFAHILPGDHSNTLNSTVSVSSELKRSNVVLMLDTSGGGDCGLSNNCSCRWNQGSPGSSPSCSPVGSRREKINEAAKNFINRFNPHRDRTSVIAYRTVAREMQPLLPLGTLWEQSGSNGTLGPGDYFVDRDITTAPEVITDRGVTNFSPLANLLSGFVESIFPESFLFGIPHDVATGIVNGLFGAIGAFTEVNAVDPSSDKQPYLGDSGGASNVIDALELAWRVADRAVGDGELGETENLSFVLFSAAPPTAGRFRFSNPALGDCAVRDLLALFFRGIGSAVGQTGSTLTDLLGFLGVQAANTSFLNRCYDANGGAGYYLYKTKMASTTQIDTQHFRSHLYAPSPLIRAGENRWIHAKDPGVMIWSGVPRNPNDPSYDPSAPSVGTETIDDSQPWIPYHYTYASPANLRPGAVNRCSTLNSLCQGADCQSPFAGIQGDTGQSGQTTSQSLEALRQALASAESDLTAKLDLLNSAQRQLQDATDLCNELSLRTTSYNSKLAQCNSLATQESSTQTSLVSCQSSVPAEGQSAPDCSALQQTLSQIQNQLLTCRGEEGGLLDQVNDAQGACNAKPDLTVAKNRAQADYDNALESRDELQEAINSGGEAIPAGGFEDQTVQGGAIQGGFNIQFLLDSLNKASYNLRSLAILGGCFGWLSGNEPLWNSPLKRFSFVAKTGVNLPGLELGVNDPAPEFAVKNILKWEEMFYDVAIVWSDRLRAEFTNDNRTAVVYTIGLGSPVNKNCNRMAGNPPASPMSIVATDPYQCLSTGGQNTQASRNYLNFARKDVFLTRLASDRQIWCKERDPFPNFPIEQSYAEAMGLELAPDGSGLPREEYCGNEMDNRSDGHYMATADDETLGALFGSTARRIQLRLINQ